MSDKLFDRKILRLNQDRIIKDFEKYNFLHQEFGDRIFENIEFLNRDFDNILEISAIDENLANKIKSKFKKSNYFSSSFSQNIKKDVVLDDELLPFKNESFDLIVSNLNMHFINEIEQFTIQIKNMLKPGGVFIASLFGEENLSELAHAIFKAENEVYGGVSPRMPPTIDVKTGANLLQKAGFINPISNFERIEVEYEDPKNLLKDLKGMGQSNILTKRSRKFAKKEFIDKILQKYKELQGESEAFKANFEIVTITGWKKND